MSNQFYPGQRVVCVEPHSQGILRVGAEYRIDRIRSCACGKVIVDVGIPSLGGNSTCATCPRRVPSDGSWWIASNRFRPYEPLKEEMDRIEKQAQRMPIIETVPA